MRSSSLPMGRGGRSLLFLEYLSEGHIWRQSWEKK
jgi:hypothetical protein